jgi:hypothetical protein
LGKKNVMMFDEYVTNNKDDYIQFKELPMLILRNVDRLINQKGRNLTTVST